MALTDHVAILLGHSFHVARLNKKKTRSDFYAQFAFPPAAIGDIAALVSEVYPGTPLSSLEVNVLPNAKQAKPFAGVPDDYYIIRLASSFAPELYAADGVTRIPHEQAPGRFFAGMKVRVNSSAWAWTNEFKKQGASFNLHGVMDAGLGGDKLNIGGGSSAPAFAAHANPNAINQGQNPGNPFGGQSAQAGQSAAAGAGTAANATASAQGTGANPFGSAGGAIGNPFQQQASGAGAQSANPFA